MQLAAAVANFDASTTIFLHRLWLDNEVRSLLARCKPLILPSQIAILYGRDLLGMNKLEGHIDFVHNDDKVSFRATEKRGGMNDAFHLMTASTVSKGDEGVLNFEAESKSLLGSLAETLRLFPQLLSSIGLTNAVKMATAPLSKSVG